MAELSSPIGAHSPPSPDSDGEPDRRRRLALLLLALGVAYFVAGKAGLLLAVGNASVSAVWPATGLAIAALILGGLELWPAIFAGAFLVNLTTTWDPGSSLGIATGNTLEGVVGAYLAIRFASGKSLLDRPTNVLTFALLSGFLACTVAATIGTLSLTAAHLARPQDFLSTWAPWWLGDSIGAIEVTPLILAFSQRLSRPHPVVAGPGLLETGALGVATVWLALVVFARPPATVLGGYTLVFLVLPPIMWAAFRFGSLGAISSVSTVSVIAILATVTGSGPFATLPPSDSLLALRIFIGSLALTALLVAADISRHRWLESELYFARKELQRLLTERTIQLEAAKSLAQVGNWTYDLPTGKMVWSEELYRVFGYPTQRFSVGLEQTLEQLSPEDGELFQGDLRSAAELLDPMNYEFPERTYRLRTSHGDPRIVVSRVHVTGVDNGRAIRVTGTVRDITELERVTKELKRLKSSDETPPPERPDLPIWMIPWARQRRPDETPLRGRRGAPRS